MKSTRNVKGKVLLSSSATVLLGLLSANPQLVKADSVPTNQAASKEDATTNKIPSPSEEVISEPTNPTDPTVNQAAVAAQDSDANASKKRIEGTVAGLQVSYDLDTDELTILGGTYANIISYDDRISKQSLSDSEGNSIQLGNAKQIVITGKINLNSSNNADYLFSGFSDVSKIVGLEYLDLSQATSTACMFSGCKDLTSLDFSSFNTANVTDMRYMFDGCSSLIHLNVSPLNTANVTNMKGMFAECTALTSLDLSSFNTANVTDMRLMFSECTALTSLNLSNFNTTNVTTMAYMFNECIALPTLDLSSFNTANVTDMEGMFKDGESLVDLDISSFDTSSLYILDEMFMNCTSLTELNLEHFHIPDIDKSDFAYTFYGCTNLRKLNIKNITTGAPEYDYMLAELPSLNTLVLGEYTDLTIVYDDDIANMDDTNVEDVGLNTEGIWLNVGNGTTIRPEGTEQYTSEQLMRAYAITMDGTQRNFTKGDTYVRMGLPITIHHVDESGKQIAEDTIFPGNFGDPYSITGDSVAGYTLKDGQSPVTGIYDNDNTKERDFTFTYVKNPESSAPIKGENVIVHYQDEQSRTVAPNEILSGNTGDGYVSAAKEIAGYTLKTRPKNATGFFSDTIQNVIYVYSKTESQTTGKGNESKNNENKSNGNKGNKANSATLPSSSRYSTHTNALGNKTHTTALGSNTNKLHSANYSNNNQLPKTGSEKRAQLVAIALGSLTLASAAALLWTKIKKFSK